MELRNLADVRDSGVLFYTREAAAILREACGAVQHALDHGRPFVPPALENLHVTEGGQLILTGEAGDRRAEVMPALADLIERVLPPSARDDPDYALPASFRVLAPRARGWPPGLPPIRTPGELGHAVGRYQDGDATTVLAGLFARTAPPADVTALGTTAATTGVDAPAPVDMPADAPASTPLTRPASANVSTPASTPTSATMSTPASTPTSAITSTPTSTPTLSSTRASVAFHDRRLWLLLASAMSVSFVASYQWTRHLSSPPMSRTATPEAVRAPQNPNQPLGAAGQSEAGRRSSPNEPSPRVTEVPQHEARVDTGGGAAPNRPSSRGSRTASAPEKAASGVAVDALALPTPTPLEMPASTGPVFSPSFAPSGSALVFHAGRDPSARLMSTDLDDAGGALEVVTLVGDSARNYHPRLSPDGRFLAFDSDRDGVRGVYVANRDGTNVRRISGPGFAAVPSWSPDMRWLAFVRAEPERPQVWNVWLQERATGELKRLTAHRYGQSWGASWFPDSQRLCYSHEDRLVVLDVSSNETRVFASPRAGRLVRTPAVSPDGRRIVFQVIRDGVWLLDVESGAMRRIIEDPTAEEFAWDPNGDRLAYHSRHSGEWKIWLTARPES